MGFVKVTAIRLSMACKDSQAVKAIHPSGLDVASRLNGQFDYIHLFAKRQEEFDDLFPRNKWTMREQGGKQVETCAARERGIPIMDSQYKILKYESKENIITSYFIFIF
jgi:hypothetical protein